MGGLGFHLVWSQDPRATCYLLEARGIINTQVYDIEESGHGHMNVLTYHYINPIFYPYNLWLILVSLAYAYVWSLSQVTYTMAWAWLCRRR